MRNTSNNFRFFRLRILIFIISLGSFAATGQNNYWVFLRDKKGCNFDPFEYFDFKAIERRLINGVPLIDSTDFPVNQNYVDLIADLVETVDFESRWFNALSVVAFPGQIELVAGLPFVKEIQQSVLFNKSICNSNCSEELILNDPLLPVRQISCMQGELFAKAGFTGKGIRIAVFDAGYTGAEDHPAFRHLRENNRIIKTFDFIRKKEFVYGHSAHGRMVLSCITGLLDNKKTGLATDAEFLLARTEYSLIEPLSEEKNWLAAAEWADKNGAQIISSSLGYYFQRYFVDQMDGKTSLVAKAALMAARKGILVVTAMGNEGDGSWKYMVTPADADSVLSVGGINPSTGLHISFSSFGPTADKRMKPNVVAFGQVVVASSDSLEISAGTSFSTPLITGFAACALQSHPEYTNMQLLNEIEKSGSLYPYFDYAHGFGIPQAGYFTESVKHNVSPTFDISFVNDTMFVKINTGLIRTDAMTRLYYHIQNTKGYLDKYAVINVIIDNVLNIPVRQIMNGEKVMIHYLGYTSEVTLKEFKN
jgi:subtilisin family serine protease